MINFNDEEFEIYLNDNVCEKLSTLYIYFYICYISSQNQDNIQNILKSEFIKYSKKIKNGNKKINAVEYIEGYLNQLSSNDNPYAQKLANTFANEVFSLHEETEDYVQLASNKPLSFTNKVSTISLLIYYTTYLAQNLSLHFEYEYFEELFEKINYKLFEFFDNNIVDNNIDIKKIRTDMQLEIISMIKNEINYEKIDLPRDLTLISLLDKNEKEIYKILFPMLLCFDVDTLEINLDYMFDHIEEKTKLSRFKIRYKINSISQKMNKIQTLDDAENLKEYNPEENKAKKLIKKIRKVN